ATGPIASRTSSTRSWVASVGHSRCTSTAGLPADTAASTKSWPSTRLPTTAANIVPGPAWRLSWVTSRTVTVGSPRTRPPTTSASSATELFLEAIGSHSETVEGLLHDLGEDRRRRLASGAVLPRRLVDHHGDHELGIVDGCQADEAGPRDVGVVSILVQ